MRAVFGNTVSAICYSIVRDESQSAGAFGRVAVSPNAVVHFVLDQHARMPDYLRFGILVLTVCFSLAGVRYGGALFHQLDAAARQRQLTAWRHSRARLPRDFVRLYESLAVFCWYSIVVSQGEQVLSPVVVVEPVLVHSGRLSPPPAAVIGETYQPACHQV